MRARRRGGDSGFSLVELSVSLFITLLVLALMGMWIMSANRMERYQGEVKEALDQMRSAKDLLVKELRFANGLSPDPAKTNVHVLTFWIDSRTQGVQGQPDAGIGEWIRWELTSDGRLVRSTDLTGAPSTTQARGLVYASGGLPGSAFAYPTTTRVDIRLVADVNTSEGAEAQTIETQVTLRNA